LTAHVSEPAREQCHLGRLPGESEYVGEFGPKATLKRRTRNEDNVAAEQRRRRLQARRAVLRVELVARQQ
jgi:hypothetical protein